LLATAFSVLEMLSALFFDSQSGDTALR
jgi:hypothetical protein